MWITPAESDVLTSLSGVELTAFRAAALQNGQADPVAEVIENNVNLVRGFIAACQRNVLGSQGTIPDKLLKPCLALITMDIMSRAAGKILDPNGQRKRAEEQAYKVLEQVAICRFAIEQPTTYDTEIIQNFKPSFSSGPHHQHMETRRRKYGLRDEDGV